MARLKSGSPPTYRLHKASGNAIVTIDGRDFYLGIHGTPASRQKYAGLIRAWEQRQAEPTPDPRPLVADNRSTINDLILGFSRHARDYYRPSADGYSGEVVCIADALDVVQKLFGREHADQFGPLKLKAVRQAMIDKKWSRGYVNHQISRVKRMFAWATADELVTGSVYHALLAMKGLRKGKGQVREGRKVGPACKLAVKATVEKAHPVLAAMIRFQWLTGCRSGEMCAMRLRDIDRSKKVWVYTVPAEANKTDHLDRRRRVYIGPRTQRVLAPWLEGGLDEFIFSPRRAEEIRLASRRANRKTPLYPSHLSRLEKKRKVSPLRPRKDHYDTKSYRTAVLRACKKAGIERWHPHQLRHTAATRFRRKYGIEVASVLLGHTKISTTEVYAERDLVSAMKAARKIG